MKVIFGKKTTTRSGSLRTALLVVICCWMLPQSGLATHIVGGELGYRCLGNNQYEITLKFYRDCLGGDPEADFDNPAVVGVFDRNGLLVTSLSLPFTGAINIGNEEDACIIKPGNVCVHYTVYKGIVELAPRVGGYQIVYQRCCRNESLDNIINPLETGSTYDIWLTEAAMAVCNSSPEFKAWPPVFICAGQPLQFDHSATDADGDSLVYRLTVPKQGATFAEPMPQPPNNPPFDTVLWQSGYSVDRVLGITEKPLIIDPRTGLLTSTPSQLGQFVVGVVVEEYQRGTGVLLSVSYRDFEFNVIDCQYITAQFEAPAAQCDDLSVSVKNTSIGASTYLWTATGNGNTLTSEEKDPTFVFPDTGTYEITLIVEPNSSCADTFSHSVFLQYNSLIPGFRADVFECPDSLYLVLQDQSVDPVSPVISWDWTIILSNSDTIYTSGQNRVVALPKGVSGSISLAVESQNGCMSAMTGSFTSDVTPPGSQVVDTLYACFGDMIGLNAGTDPDNGFQYRWTGLPDGADSTALNPVIEATQNATYTVRIFPTPAACEVVKTVTLILYDPTIADFGIRPTDCDGFAYRFENLSTNADSITWIIGSPAAPLLVDRSEILNYTFPEAGEFPVTLIAHGNCPDTLTQMVTAGEDPLVPDFDFSYQDCTPGSLDVRFSDSTRNQLGPIQSYLWTLEDGRTSTEQHPVFTFSASTTLDVKLRVETAEGCLDSITKTVSITLIEDVADMLPDSFTVCRNVPTGLPVSNDPRYSYQWEPATGLDRADLPNPEFLLSSSAGYRLTISIPGTNCHETDSIFAFVPDSIRLSVTGDEFSCDQPVALSAATVQPAAISWLDSARNVLATGNQFAATGIGAVRFYVRAEDNHGCQEESSKLVLFGSVEVDVPEYTAVCAGDPIQVNTTQLDPTDVLTYSWTPASAILSGGDGPDPMIDPAGGNQSIYVTITNQFNCKLEDSTQVVIIGEDAILDFTAEVGCDGITVQFVNNSQNVPAYQWNFGDPARPDAGSRDSDPVYKYPDTGSYQVYLTYPFLLPEACNDTLFKTVVIEEILLDARFSSAIQDCGEGPTTLAFTDESIDPRGAIVAWWWTFGNGDSSQMQNPVISVNEAGPLTATLRVMTFDSCFSSLTRTIDVPVIDLNLADTLADCTGAGVFLNPTGDPGLSYSWTPATGLSDPLAANPLAAPGQTTTYSVTVQAFGTDTCTVVRTVTVVVPEPVMFTAPNDTVTCGEAIELTAVTAQPLTFEWLDGSGATLSKTASVTVDPEREETYYIRGVDAYGCSALDSVRVISNGVDLTRTPADTFVSCSGQNVKLVLTNTDPRDTLTYVWSPPSLLLNGQGTPSVIATIVDSISEVSSVVTNQFGCTDTVVFVIEAGTLNVDLPDTVRVCAGASVPLAPNANPEYQYVWSPATGLSDSTVANPIFSGTESITYTVVITDTTTAAQCSKTETVVVLVGDAIELVAGAYPDTICAPGTVDLSATTTTAGVEIKWYAAGDLSAELGTGTTFTASIAHGVNSFVAIGNSGFGCTDTLAFAVTGIDVSLAVDTLVGVCQGAPTPINPQGNPNYTYTWTPTTGLDLTEPFNPVATLDQDQTFRAIILDPVSGCTDTFEVNVVVGLPPAFTGPADTVVCNLDPLTLEAASSEAATWRWTDTAGNVLSEEASLTVTPVEGEQIFLVEAISAEGCKSPADTVRVTAIDFQTGLESPLEVCIDVPTPLVIDGNPDYIYNWTPTTGLDLTVPSNPIATLQENTIYVVNVEDPISGCSETKTVEVIVNGLPDLVAAPDTSVCSLDPVQVRATSSTATRFVWLNADGREVGNGAMTEVTPVSGTNIFYVIGIDENSCADLDSVIIEATDFQPGLPSPVEACAGIPTPLNPQGNPEYTYTWTPTDGLDLTDPSNPVATLDQTTVYSVTAVDPVSGCSESKVVEVRVNPLPEVTAAPDTAVCSLDPVAVRAVSATATQFTWYNGAGEVVGSGAMTSLTPVAGRNVFVVEARDANGCPAVDSVVIEATDFQPGLSSPVEVCEGQEAELNPEGNPAYTYTWEPADGLDLSDPSNPRVTLTEAMTYQVTATDPGSGCSIETEIEVIVNEVPHIITKTADTTLCEPQDFTLNAETDIPATVSWFRDLELTDLIGTGNTLTVSVEKGRNVFYLIADNGKCSSAGIGDWELLLRNNGRGPDSIVVDVVDFDPVRPETDQIVCPDVPTPLNGNGSDAFTYLWSPATGLDDPNAPNPIATLTEPTTYLVRITDPTGLCTIEDTVRITPAPPIEPDAGQDTLLCSLAPITLEAASATTATFEWSLTSDFADVFGTDASQAIDPVAGSTTYYLRATDEFGCTEIDSVMVEAYPVTAELPAEVVVCSPGEAVTLTVTNNAPQQELMYFWEPIGAILSDPTTGPSAQVVLQENGEVSVELENQFGCRDTLATTVNVVDFSGVRIEAEDTVITKGATTAIRVLGCEDCTYSWSPATGLDNTTDSVVRATPAEATTYMVTVSKMGCDTVLEMTIIPTECTEEYVFVPTAFTPNGDGENDLLFVRSEIIAEMHFIIFNRWGQEVFDTRDQSIGWDGTFRGEELAGDVFGWYLEIICFDGGRLEMRGNVTLIR